MMQDNANGNERNCFVAGEYPRVSIVAGARFFHLFHWFLQHGFFIEAKPGESVKSMLCDRLGVDSEYAVDRIKTLFLDGKPVDDMEKAYIRDGCSLALSAAMPGLVGATFRSGGVLSPFRAAISYRPEECDTAESEIGAVYLKLFNLLVPEMGPAFLENGIYVGKGLAEEFFRDSESDLEAGCSSITMDERPVGIRELAKNGIGSSKNFIFLRVKKE